MTSGNAFRDAAHAPLAATSNGHSEHARKRRKLSPPPQANLYTRTGDASVALEVDHMILDYLSYEATKTVLASRISEDMHYPSPQHKLALVDSFLEMFKAKHPNFTPDSGLRFRLLLLKFTTLYCHRLVQDAVVPSKAALRQLRETNTSRAMSWIQTADRMPSNNHDMSAFEAAEAQNCPSKNQSQQLHLTSRRAQTLESLQYPPEDEAYQYAFYGTPESLALLDLLPLFMSVIAARNELNNSNLSPGLMELAAQFMLQASLEQYLVRGASGCDAVDEAFAWGCRAAPLATGDGHGNRHDEVDSDGSKGEGAVDPTDEVDRMFQDEEEPSREVTDWSTVKSGFISQLARTNGDPFMRHLERVADKHPIDVFEQMVLQLLAGLAASLPNPILTQLEEGTLDGMSAEEMEAFLGECGLKGHWPLPSGYKQ
jgi:hypothetical protein